MITEKVVGQATSDVKRGLQVMAGVNKKFNRPEQTPDTLSGSDDCMWSGCHALKNARSVNE